MTRSPDLRGAPWNDYSWAWGNMRQNQCEISAGMRGLLWEVTPACEASLDRHEGVSKGAYRRDTVIVAAEDGYREALVYIATDPTTGANRYGDRWPKISDAAKRHGFPAFYLTELVSFSL